MAGTATITQLLPKQSTFLDRKMRRPRSRFGTVLFVLALAAGLVYIAVEISKDLASVPAHPSSCGPD